MLHNSYFLDFYMNGMGKGFQQINKRALWHQMKVSFSFSLKILNLTAQAQKLFKENLLSFLFEDN